jgi:4-phosphopantoate---beta-alanine ligase
MSEKKSIVPKSHPRYQSLMQRHLIEEGVNAGFVTMTGMVAQGRGEAFDYLIGEKTTENAAKAEQAAAAMLLLAESPVISVNGNVAALCPNEVVALAKEIDAKIEINLFYRTPDREKKIRDILFKSGAEKVYGAEEKFKTQISGTDSARGSVDKRGIYSADVVLVSLEDGDRTEALVEMGKKVIVIDLNPLSRSPQSASLAITDNVIRAMPKIRDYAKQLKFKSADALQKLARIENREILNEDLKIIKNNLI